MIVALVVASAVLGLAVGSFLNVVVWRVPRGGSVVRPRSACPSCGSPIRPVDNIPVLSWLALRGRCRDCSEPISFRYPLVETGTAVGFVLMTVRLGLVPELPAFLYLTAVGIALALIDLDFRRLPNAIILPSYAVLAVLFGAAALITGDGAAALRVLIGGATLWGIYFILAVARPGGMGFGDVKLAGLLGGAMAWLGWGSLVVGAFSAFLLGGLFAIGLLVAGRAGRASKVPFGPWMILGAAVGIGVGEQIWEWYRGLAF